MKSGLLISFRVLFKNKLFTAINLLNLIVGISACLLLLKYVRYELSFDKFYLEAEKVYRISYERFQNGNLDIRNARTMSALAPALKRDFPEIEEAIRGCYEECLIYRKEEQKYLNKQKVLWADDGFLDVFRIQLIKGDRETALRDPYTAIISESQAAKLFGEEDPMGKSFSHNEGLVFQVTGVFEDLPQNTHLELEFIYSYITFADWPFGQSEGSWLGNWLYTYIRVNDSFNPAKFEAELNERVNTYMPDLESRNMEVNFYLQPLNGIHLDSNLDNEVTINGERRTVIILVFIAVMILFIAWINFINLMVAQNAERGHEFGIRKVLGENRKTLFRQSMFVILIINAIAFGFSLLIIALINPLFNQIFDLPGSAILYKGSLFWPLVTGIFGIGVLMIGFYPSMVNTRVDTRNVASRAHARLTRKVGIRKALVVIQFALSAILIFNALTLSRQVNFMLDKELGFNSEQVIILNAPETWCQTPDSVKFEYIDHLRNILISYPEIGQVSSCNFAPGSESWTSMGKLSVSNSENIQEQVSIPSNRVDNHYFEVLEVEYLAGNSFHREYGMDRNSVILNESAMKLLGIMDPESAINRIISNDNAELRIVGIVKDHHHLGIKNPIKPMIYFHRYAYDFGFLLIKTAGDTRKGIQLIQQHWEEEFPVALFDYDFLDDFYNQQYKPEFRLRKSIAFFAVIAMILACVGLFSLLKFSLDNRVKEISIKRTLGASIRIIMLKLSSEFLALVGISLVIAFLTSWFIANQWLQNFPYRTNISVWIFVISSVLILMGSVVTLVWHIYRASTQNPVIGLKDE